MNVNFNFFAWIREGVRQSILLGVSDAIENIGAPDNANDLHPQLREFLHGDGARGDGSSRAIEGQGGSGNGGSANRKRLGRRLKDLEKPAAAS
jgi:hypothetical protein